MIVLMTNLPKSSHEECIIYMHLSPTQHVYNSYSYYALGLLIQRWLI